MTSTPKFSDPCAHHLRKSGLSTSMSVITTWIFSVELLGIALTRPHELNRGIDGGPPCRRFPRVSDTDLFHGTDEHIEKQIVVFLGQLIPHMRTGEPPQFGASAGRIEFEQ